MFRTVVLYSSLVFPLVSIANDHLSVFQNLNANEHDESEGCHHNGLKHPVGEVLLMNEISIEKHKDETGYYPPDGYGVLMLCTYLVNPKEQDHPRVKDREYVWVSFQW